MEFVANSTRRHLFQGRARLINRRLGAARMRINPTKSEGERVLHGCERYAPSAQKGPRPFLSPPSILARLCPVSRLGIERWRITARAAAGSDVARRQDKTPYSSWHHRIILDTQVFLLHEGRAAA